MSGCDALGLMPKVGVQAIARDGDGNITGIYENDSDLICQSWAQFVILQILAQGSTLTVTDQNEYGALDCGNARDDYGLTINAGIGAAAASVTDYTLGTLTAGSSGSVAAVVNWATESSGTSGSFTVTGTITNSTGSHD